MKVAFLINPNDADWQEKVDAVWEHNQHSWGGRYNPIIPTDGETLQGVWWTFLKEFEPDFLYVFSAVSSTLAEQLNKELRPIEIEFDKPRNAGVDVLVNSTHNGVEFYPSDASLRRFQKIVSNDMLAAIRGLKRVGDPIIYRFLLQNFGLYADTYPLDRLLEKVEKKLTIRARNRDELRGLFTTLDSPNLDFVFPLQFSMHGQPDMHLELEGVHSYDVFGLIVGDTFNDQVFLRNKPHFERDSTHQRVHHMWLPMFFTEDDQLMSALGSWLRRQTSNVHLFSFSIEQSTLDSIGDKLDISNSGTPYFSSLYKSSTSFVEFPSPKYGLTNEYPFWSRYRPSISIPKGCEIYNSPEIGDKTVEIIGPSQTDGTSEKGSWIAEVFLKATRERYYEPNDYYQNWDTFWWRLPRKNYLAEDIFGVQARVDGRGIPVVKLSGRSSLLRTELPDDIELIKSCLVGDWKGRLQGTIPKRGAEVDFVQPSNIGKYLAGFIEIFGGLGLAHQYLEDRFWRNTFTVMANREPAKDSKLLRRVQDKLRKRVRKGLTDAELADSLESLSEFVVLLAKEVALEGKEMDFLTLSKNKALEHEELMALINEKWPYNQKALEFNLSKLLDTGALLMGVKQKCPRCGSQCWFPVDELSHKLTCSGCRQTFSLESNPTFLYRLSTLVRHGIFTHGLVPVTLVLGQLLEDARSSFFYGPCMDIYTALPRNSEGKKYEKLTDTDIACIQDGRLIIGEIKSSQSQFTLSQMSTLAEVAEIVDADVLLFSSLEEKVTKRTAELIEKVKQQLQHTKIEVDWYALDKQAFEPSRGDY